MNVAENTAPGMPTATTMQAGSKYSLCAMKRPAKSRLGNPKTDSTTPTQSVDAPEYRVGKRETSQAS